METANGERYTRDGNFAVDADGYLVTADGNYVLGENGRIYVGSDTFTVAPDGSVTGENAVPDKLRLVTFEDGSLRKQGDSLYYPYGDAQPATAIKAEGLRLIALLTSCFDFLTLSSVTAQVFMI